MPDAGTYNAYEVLSNQDIADIAKCAAMLPGGWTVDPIADIRQPGRPCVWLDPAPSNPISVSFRIHKKSGLFWINVRYHGSKGPITDEGSPCGSLGWAFASYGEELLTLWPDLVGL
jgi:hypothetical protein